MINFEYYTPTKIIFGKETENKVGELIKARGSKKVLVHYGGGSVRRSGLLDRVFASLTEAGIHFIELGGVVPNPRLSLARQGVELCKKEHVDFILAVGGGSVIDSAKSIAYGALLEQDVWDVYDNKVKPTTCLPVGTILTIAAAGSEMSDSSVLTNDETNEKRGYGNELGRPVFSIMNPELTLTLPAYQTAVGAADILMHTMERYFTPNETMLTTDGIAESLMRTVMASARYLTRQPNKYDARAELMWAGSLSHNGLTGCGGGHGDWSCHQLGHELSGMFDLAHGASLSCMWGSWARYIYKKDPARFAQFAEDVLQIQAKANDEQTALAGIEEMENFFWSIEVPTTVGEAGIEITDEQIEEMVRKCSRDGKRTIGAMVKLNAADMREIYKMAR